MFKSQYQGGGKMKFLNKELVEVEEHTKCKCDCKKKESDCTKFQRYNKSQCLCVCINIEDKNKCLAVSWMDPLFKPRFKQWNWNSFLSLFVGLWRENLGSRQLHMSMSWSKRCMLHWNILWFKHLHMPRGTWFIFTPISIQLRRFSGCDTLFDHGDNSKRLFKWNKIFICWYKRYLDAKFVINIYYLCFIFIFVSLDHLL